VAAYAVQSVMNWYNVKSLNCNFISNVMNVYWLIWWTLHSFGASDVLVGSELNLAVGVLWRSVPSCDACQSTWWVEVVDPLFFDQYVSLLYENDSKQFILISSLRVLIFLWFVRALHRSISTKHWQADGQTHLWILPVSSCCCWILKYCLSWQKASGWQFTYI
jgi:hypothetical protein